MTLQRPMTVCRAPGCTTIARGRYCPEHRNGRGVRGWVQWKKKPGARPYGAQHRKLAEQQLRRYPLCAECMKTGQVTLATDADHVVPRFEGGQDVRSNYQSLCHNHHVLKTAAEAARAKRKGKGAGGAAGPANAR